MISSLLLGVKVNNACRLQVDPKKRDFPFREGNKWKIFPTFLLNNKFVRSEASQCQKKQFEKLSSTRLRRLLKVADPDIIQIGGMGGGGVRFGNLDLEIRGLSPIIFRPFGSQFCIQRRNGGWCGSPGPSPSQIRHWTTALNRRKTIVISRL